MYIYTHVSPTIMSITQTVTESRTELPKLGIHFKNNGNVSIKILSHTISDVYMYMDSYNMCRRYTCLDCALYAYITC